MSSRGLGEPPARNHLQKMRLQRPTDFLILEAFSDGENYTALATAWRIKHVVDTNDEKSSRHINNRLPILEDYGLIEKVPPLDNSGLYHITKKGQVVLSNREKYGDEGLDFDSLIEDELAGEEVV